MVRTVSNAKRAVISLTLVLLGVPVHATTLARMSLEKLAAAADAIVEARCLQTETHLENGEVWTFAEFEVSATRKGVTPRLISVRLLGGRWGHLTSRVEGVPEFHAGEEAILFLQRTRVGDFALTSWMQGTFRVRRDALSGAATVTQDSSVIAVFDPATRQFRHEGVRRTPLADFRKFLDAVVAKQQNRREP